MSDALDRHVLQASLRRNRPARFATVYATALRERLYELTGYNEWTKREQLVDAMRVLVGHDDLYEFGIEWLENGEAWEE